MVDTPATAAQVDSVFQEAETMGNQALARFVPGAAPIVLLIEHMVINPMLPALEKSLAAQINSNEAAKAVFNLVMLGLGFVAGKFLPPGVTPPK
jgi:hypothetical protein